MKDHEEDMPGVPSYHRKKRWRLPILSVPTLVVLASMVLFAAKMSG